MSQKHLAKGSAQPPKVEGKLRLYSMAFCPFAERARLILLVKNIPHDIVNVHLKNKPEWLFNLNSQGKVPILDTGSEVIAESLDICDYLNDKYPEPSLYPQDAKKQEEDKILIREYGQLTTAFYRYDKSFEEYFKDMVPLCCKYENELKKRGTYFGGEKPSMVDYMIWPWAERAESVGLLYKNKIPGEDEFPILYSWCKAMRNQDAVRKVLITPKQAYELRKQYSERSPEDVDYDSI